jgi:hypothetical protein
MSITTARNELNATRKAFVRKDQFEVIGANGKGKIIYIGINEAKALTALANTPNAIMTRKSFANG